MISIRDIAWAAGIYEGEGNFTGKTVRVVQKDSWLVYELQRIFGGKVKQYNGYHQWTMHGWKCRGFILTIFTFLSPRRKAQILEYPLFFKNPNFLQKQFCNKGHKLTPDNIVQQRAGDKRWRSCKICYMENYTKKNQLKSMRKPEDNLVMNLAKLKGISIEEAKKLLVN